MLAACLWEALKRHGTPRMPKNIGEIFNLPIRHVTKGIKQFQSLFAVRLNGQQTDTYTSPAPKVVASGTSDKEATARANQRRAVWQKTASPTTSYRDFIQPYLTNLSIPRHAAAKLEAAVFDVCARIEDLGIVPENTPPSLTASVITFCSQEMGIRIDISEIARVCGISVVTIQKCLKRITPMKEKLLSK
jgi:transcription initiation factor TFIIIB Brf1 subunit/transcription initiation factor TFIIB